MPDDAILRFENVSKEFPGVKALSEVSFSVKRGEIHGICGENGAGKSTLMKILSGVYPHGTYNGKVYFHGKELQLGVASIRQAIEEGIAIVYQELTLIPNITVGENIYLGKEPRKGYAINWDKLYADCNALLEQFKLPIQSRAIVKELGVGQMQMTEIAKALSEKAKIIILDEPTSALSESEVEQLMTILTTLKNLGVTCMYITHKLHEFFRIADTITIMRDGKVVSSQPTSSLSLEKLVSLMVGREMKERFPKGNRKPGNVFFTVENLHARYPNDPGREVIKGVSFTMRKGEILGVAGLMGSGRTELVTTIFGEFGLITEGRIMIDSQEVVIKNARDAMRLGISLVPEDRKRQGLVLIQSILQNICLPNLQRFSKFMYINKNSEIAQANNFAANLSIKAPSVHSIVETLSGGNQQKVVISKWLMSEPKILILDDPTRGIDVGAKFEIYKLMNQLAEKGYSIIMISSDLEEILGMSDRIMVMWEGRSNGTLDISEASQERIIARATGIEVA